MASGLLRLAEMKQYRSLFRRSKSQGPETAFCHFYPVNGDYDALLIEVADKTSDGLDAWKFTQDRFASKYLCPVPKLRNYLDYTFVRLLDLESESPQRHFRLSSDGDWICFNTGLQNEHQADLLAIFQRYKARALDDSRPKADWVFKGCFAPNERAFRDRFGTQVPEIAWYSTDSQDYVFNTVYTLEKDVFGHLFERAKERAGMPNAPDDVVRTYLRGALGDLIPKIKRNYKVAIPVWYVEERRMQLLLPFVSVSDANDVSCFLVERDDGNRSYQLKTIFDLDQAYFSARLITRPDREWLNP
jgi:hypothetical protein